MQDITLKQKDYARLKNLLQTHYERKNDFHEISIQKPDPLLVARSYIEHKHLDEIALFCALFSYGNARLIVRFLQNFDFSLLGSQRSVLSKRFTPYRFQSAEDVGLMCEVLRLCIAQGGIKTHFLKAYNSVPTHILNTWKRSKNPNHARILYGIYASIELLRDIAYSLLPQNSPLSHGLEFLLGKSYRSDLESDSLPRNASPLKRWNMYLRWLVRHDEIDLGAWEDEVSKSHLILPLDTHTFRLCKSLGLICIKSYDLRAALQATDTLSILHKDDPIAYDFALYRLGQYDELRLK